MISLYDFENSGVETVKIKPGVVYLIVWFKEDS